MQARLGKQSTIYNFTGFTASNLVVADSSILNDGVMYASDWLNRTSLPIQHTSMIGDIYHQIEKVGQKYRIWSGGAKSSLIDVLTLDTSGLVGIITGTPTQELDVNGDTRLRAHLYDYDNTNGSQNAVLTRGTSGVQWRNPTSTITPSQITSDQDNYNPTGFDTARIIRISGDNGIRAITGFAAQDNGEEKLLINVGSYTIYLPGEHPDATAANRFISGLDCMIYPREYVTIIYDGISSRWRIGKKEVIDQPPSGCLLYTSDAADERSSVDLGGRRIIKKKNKNKDRTRIIPQESGSHNNHTIKTSIEPTQQKE